MPQELVVGTIRVNGENRVVYQGPKGGYYHMAEGSKHYVHTPSFTAYERVYTLLHWKRTALRLKEEDRAAARERERAEEAERERAAVLLACTQDLMLAGFATLSILCSMMSVIGLVTSWELGSIEAILISILAGFSVDYVVHLAHAYIMMMQRLRVHSASLESFT